MSQSKDLPENSIRLTAIVEGDMLRLSTGYHFSEDFERPCRNRRKRSIWILSQMQTISSS
jgi:hypothetical protein